MQSREKVAELRELLEATVDGCSNDGQDELLCLLFLVNGKVKLEDFLRVAAISDFFASMGLQTCQCIALLDAAASSSEYFEVRLNDSFEVLLRPGHEVLQPPMEEADRRVLLPPA